MIKEGIINGIRLKTRVYFDDKIYLDGTPWFNPPLVLPFDDIIVKKGDLINISLSYNLGAGFSSIKYDVY